LGTNHVKQYALIETSWKKWPKNANDPKDDKLELPILKYDANKDAFAAKKEGNPMEEEQEMKTPLALKYEDEEDSENTKEESCGSCN
jgi:hypothetical protein